MKRAIEIGAAGRNAAANVKRLRTARGMSLDKLSEALTAAGRPLTRWALSTIELSAKPGAKNVRRIDVDDLVALAAALGAEPSQLLLPPSDLVIEVRVAHGGEGDE